MAYKTVILKHTNERRFGRTE